MLSSRVGVAAMRGASSKNLFAHNVAKMALASRVPSTVQSRTAVTTTRATPAEGNAILASQRLSRPVSPNLGIYKLEQTWFGASAWTRITGCALSGAAYVYFALYLAAPLLGWHVGSASLAAAFGAWPLLAKGAVKFALGFPFVFHFINGIKHLIYDFGIGFAKAQIVRGEIALWVSSVVGGLALAFGL